MNKITISISALILALGVLNGCGEKKEEAAKAEAPAAKQEGMSGMSGMGGMSGEQTGMSGMSGMGGMSGEQTGTYGMGGMSGEQTGMSGMGGMSGEQTGMSGMSGMGGMSGEQTGMSGMSGMGGMSGEQAKKAAGPVDGEKIYRGLCFSCHDAGVAGAPKLGDKTEWGPRIAKGGDALHKSAIEGLNTTPGKVMPPKGGNPTLSDDEVKAAVDFMIAKSK